MQLRQARDGGGADELERLVAGRALVGVDGPQVDLVALATVEIENLSTRLSSLASIVTPVPPSMVTSEATLSSQWVSVIAVTPAAKVMVSAVTFTSACASA